MLQFALLVGMDPNQVIGMNYVTETNQTNSMCIHHPKDRQHVKSLTTFSKTERKNAIIVGRKTYETLPLVVKQCPRRDFIVMSRSGPFHSVREVIQYCMSKQSEYESFFIFGGAEIYNAWMQETNLVLKLYVSIVFTDQHFPQTANQKPIVFDLESHLHAYTLRKKNNMDGEVEFRYYKRTYLPYEYQYGSLVKQIQLFGSLKNSRNGWTKNIEGYTLTVDLNDGFPVPTLRKGFLRGIFEELCWFLSGSTDVNVLKNKNVHIWDKHSSKEYFLEAGITHLQEGDIGPGYGFQMLHSGATYIDCKTDYKGQGINQLQNIVDLIKQDPTSRRMIINLWNVKDVEKMALPCCHYSYQFSVTDGRLHGSLTQRSWDLCLGWNTSTLAGLILTIADYCDLQPGIAIHSARNIHIHQAHEAQMNEMMQRVPYLLPKIKIIGPKPASISEYKAEQFQVIDYNCNDAIKMDLL
jgi:dihydrofolate reductase/thymidylate synthase